MSCRDETLKDEKTGIFAADIEHTGGPFGQIIAIGFAHASPAKPTEIHGLLICRHLNKPEGTSWLDSWKESGWDVGTYEWWSNKLELLDYFQSRSADAMISVDTDKDLAAQFNQALAQAEAMYERTFVVVDAPLVEPGLLHHLLASHGFNPLGYTRDGKYRSGVCADSWQHWALQLDPFTHHVHTFSNAQQTKIDPLRFSHTPYSHNPTDDAITLLERTFATLLLLKTGTSSSQRSSSFYCFDST